MNTRKRPSRVAHIRVLVADDDPSTTMMLAAVLTRWKLRVTVARDGKTAWEQLQADPPLEMAILDWEMPGATGPELCMRVRRDPARAHMHLLLLTARKSRADVVAGLDAGADDYLTKPYDIDELRARIQVGVRVATLQQRLAQRVDDLERALAEVKQLTGLLPICSYCKRIRCDHGYWEQLESYLSSHTDAQFTHGVCPKCYETVRKQIESMSSELAVGR
jgi:phosphoserine phosphatase RsbU/P